jgi:hypothetical protein
MYQHSQDKYVTQRAHLTQQQGNVRIGQRYTWCG